jgi:integrase/recombinase XerD
MRHALGQEWWYRRRWYPLGIRPLWVYDDQDEWLRLYAAVEPITGQPFCWCLPPVSAPTKKLMPLSYEWLTLSRSVPKGAGGFPPPSVTPRNCDRQVLWIAQEMRDPYHWRMPYQFKREPLTQDEATRLANACQSHPEKLAIWTLLDTGLRVSELAKLTKENIDWQGHRLTVYGKGGPYGSQTKRRIIPLSARVQPLLEGHFALHDTVGMAPRTIQVLVKRVANRAYIRRPVTPHVLRHTFSVTAIQKGISLPALQRLLGHDHLATTEIYLNLSPEEVVREFREKW